MSKFDKHVFQMACNHDELVVLWLVNLPPGDATVGHRVMWRSASVTAPLLGECDVELSMDSPQVATAISNEGGMYQGDVLRI